MKKSFKILILLLSISLNSIAQKPSDFGFRHLQYVFEKDTIDVLIKSKKGEELVKKPLFFEMQGSLATPLIIHNGKKRTSFISIAEGFVEDDYHLAIVNKPGVPLIVHRDSLVDGREYFKDKKNYIYTEEYLKNNNLEYYTKTNIRVLDSLVKLPFIDSSKIVVSGHSQGSTVAAAICSNSALPTHLIYSSGLPYYSTILAILHQQRMKEVNAQNPKVANTFKIWEEVVNDTLNHFHPNRDSNKTLYSFSKSDNKTLMSLKIPVLISYGSKDESYPYNDMFHIETIKEKRTNFTFLDYFGLGHNYQRKVNNAEMKKDYLADVVKDWLQWLKAN